MKEGYFIKRFLYYFTATVIIGLLIYWGSRYQLRLEETASREFNLIPAVWYSVLFPIVIGLLLRLPKFILQIIENRSWSFDWIKFIAVAAPTLYVIVMTIFTIYPATAAFVYPQELIMYGTPMLQTIAGIAFGYILLDSMVE